MAGAASSERAEGSGAERANGDGPERAESDRPQRLTREDTGHALTIRDARPEDWAAIWPFFREIVAAGETYAYDRDMSEAEACRIWMVRPPGRTVVATDAEGTVLGTANMYANRGGPGSHVASASFMVDPRRARQGVGRALGEDMIEWARESGFRAIQFNAVVETNEGAVALWRSLGFKVVASVPEAFDHPRHGYVALLIMHRFV